MLRSEIAAGCLALLVAAACRPEGTESPDGDPKQTDAKDGHSAPTPRGVPEPEFAGVAHTGTIDGLSVCPDGTCAITRDNVGGLRLWPTLDGSAEPQPIPVRGASAFSAAAGGGDRWTVFVVEASGGARIFSVAPDGTADETAALPPFSPILEGHVLVGGKRALALFKDGTIRLLDTKGTELAKFDERKFQPNKLRIGADATQFTAVMGGQSGAAATSIEVQRMKIAGTSSAPKIERHGPPRVIASSMLLDGASSAMSTDARRFAVAGRGVGDKWEIDVYDLAKDSKPTTHLVKVPAHVVPHVGFVSPTKLIVSSNEGTVSWLIDLRSGDAWPRSAIPQDFSHQGKVQASAGGRQVVAYGSWLFVQDVAKRRHRFLGYKAAQGAGIAVSPSNGFVAWAYMGGPVYVEGIGKSAAEAVRLQLEANFGVTKVRFVDEDHLVVVDGAGGVSLYHWPTQTLIDQAGVMGNIRNVEIDSAQGLLLIDRHNNDASVFEVTSKGFAGPYIVADQSYRLGLLQPTPPSAAVLWTLDGTNKLRTYTLDELRKDLSRSQIEAMGQPLPSGQPAPLAIDRDGRQYGIRWNGTQLELFVAEDKNIGTKAVPSGDINQIVPAPNGKRFLVVFNRSGTISVAAHATKDLKPLWSYSTGVFNNDVSWSEDGDLVGLAANTGAVLLDAKTGRPLARRCGLEFAAVSSPPANAFTNFGQRSLCEI
jgi:hypothetical protein